MTKVAVNPGLEVKRNVTVFQLRAIIAHAKAGGYGEDSAAVFARARTQLAELQNNG